MLFLALLVVAVAAACVLTVSALLAPRPKAPSEELKREIDAAD